MSFDSFEEQALWEAIKAEPPPGETRAGPLGVYADWLEERQAKPELAFALRWAARHGRYPFVSPQGRSIWWAVLQEGQHKPALHLHRLPRIVFDQFRPRPRTGRRYRRYESVYLAFLHLADALQRLREAVA